MYRAGCVYTTTNVAFACKLAVPCAKQAFQDQCTLNGWTAQPAKTCVGDFACSEESRTCTGALQAAQEVCKRKLSPSLMDQRQNLAWRYVEKCVEILTRFSYPEIGNVGRKYTISEITCYLFPHETPNKIFLRNSITRVQRTTWRLLFAPTD
jgi:hypothetical protein